MSKVIFSIEYSATPKGYWKTDYAEFPDAVKIAWECDTIVEYDLSEIPFEYAVKEFIADCKRSDQIIGHNTYFELSVVKAQILRTLGEGFYEHFGVGEALDKSKRVDLMHGAMKWADTRAQNGRLKAPSLDDLFARCYPNEKYENRLIAVKRCYDYLQSNGILSK